MYPHRIRLRGPWECEPPASAEPFRVPFPCRWEVMPLAELAGRVRFRRRFGYPGRIDAHERVWVTFAETAGTAEVWLNGRSLGRHEGGGPFAFEVTACLERRNELVVEVDAATVPRGAWGDVALEIRRA
jgi:hypothetical protein